MNITVNGTDREVVWGDTLDSVVISLGSGRSGVAAALNGDVVPRSAWPITELQPGDVVEILGAAQGG